MVFTRLVLAVNFVLTLSRASAIGRRCFHHFETSTRYDIDYNVARHLQEITSASPVHILINSGATSEMTDVLLSKYLSSRAVLLNSADSLYAESIMTPSIKAFIGVFERIDDVDLRLLINIYSDMWDARSKAALWIKDSPDKQLLTSTLQQFWVAGSLNVVTFVPTNSGIYTYDPFHLNAGEEPKGILLQLSSNDELFPDKMKNLQGELIRVSMYNDSYRERVMKIPTDGRNHDAWIVSCLASWLNFTMEVVSGPMSLGEYQAMTLPSGEQIGVTYDLVTNRSDILANFQFLETAFHQEVEFMQPYIRTLSQILVPAPGVVPDVIRTFRSLDKHTLTLCAAISLTVVCYMYFRNKAGPFINTVRLFIHQQFWAINETSPERILAISWVFSVYIFMGIQQSQVVQNMTSPPFYKGINTLEELVKSKLTIITDPYIHLALNNSDEPLLRTIADRIQVDSNYFTCLYRMRRGHQVACARDSLTILDKKKTSKLQIRSHKMEETLGEYWRTMLVRKGFPYLKKFNLGFRRLQQFGLIQQYITSKKRPNYRRQSKYDDIYKTNVLNLKHFKGCFMLFGFGSSFAIVAFFAEILMSVVYTMLKTIPK